MRLLHTSDWHLGHTLRELPRDQEHRRFLDWLLDVLGTERIDALLVAGDIFHTANPSAAAQALWYGFLAEARRRHKSLDIVVIGGNHDSAARLDAPDRLLDAMRIHVVGGVPRDAHGAIDVERVLVPLTDAEGYVRAWVAAIPYLRRADLPVVPEGEAGDPLVEAVRQLHAQVFEAARRKRWAGQALLAMGHCYMGGSALSAASERKVLGNAHALPDDIFPENVAYAALGHLHLAQTVGGRDNVRYSGSPLPLSMGEATYAHQCVRVELDGDRFVRAVPLPVPRSVEMMRIPDQGALPIEEALLRLQRLSPSGEGEAPYLQVVIDVDSGDAFGRTTSWTVRRRVEQALDGRHARLVTLDLETAVRERGLADAAPGRHLQDLHPEDVFASRYRQQHGGPPPDQLRAAFQEIVEGLHTEIAARA
jgi:exonuclease SbcD